MISECDWQIRKLIQNIDSVSISGRIPEIRKNININVSFIEVPPLEKGVRGI
jgi:hypothetical protein